MSGSGGRLVSSLAPRDPGPVPSLDGIVFYWLFLPPRPLPFTRSVDPAWGSTSGAGASSSGAGGRSGALGPGNAWIQRGTL